MSDSAQLFPIIYDLRGIQSESCKFRRGKIVEQILGHRFVNYIDPKEA